MRKENIHDMKKYLIVIVSVLMIGVYGCTMKPNNVPEQNYHETEYEVVGEAKEYLTDKYGSFYYEVLGFFEAGWNHEYDLLNLAVEIDGQKESFSVQRHKTESGYIFQDNYFGLLIRPSFEERVSALAKDYFEEYKVYATLTQNYPDNLTDATQIDDLLALDNLQNISVVVTVKDISGDMEKFESTAAAFVDQWSKEEIPSTVRVICLSCEVFENISRSNVSSVYVENQLAEYRKILK